MPHSHISHPIPLQPMGNCISNQHHTPFTTPDLEDDTDLPSASTSPSPPLDYPVTSVTCVVVHRYLLAPNDPPHWLFEYCLNLAPIRLGQPVSLHLRAEDCFNPDPTLAPVAAGWLHRITNRTPHWLTFQITDLEGRDTALLSVPYVPAAWLTTHL
jgi:hypothetical protein